MACCCVRGELEDKLHDVRRARYSPVCWPNVSARHQYEPIKNILGQMCAKFNIEAIPFSQAQVHDELKGKQGNKLAKKGKLTDVKVCQKIFSVPFFVTIVLHVINRNL